MKRLCIYVTYNKENIVQPYVGYMLKAMKPHVESLCVVCNYPKILGGEEFVFSYADEVFYRENKGFDCGAYKDTLCSLLGWEKVCQYDELLFMNDSFFGPINSLKKCFVQMEEVDCDFWGIAKNSAGTPKTLGFFYGPHVQSYFLVFRKKVILSDAFKYFFEMVPYPERFMDSVRNFEIGLSEYLERKGFSYMTLAGVQGMVFEEDEIAHYLYSLEMIRDKGMPFLKKKSLLIRNRGFINTYQAIKYIEENTEYPVKWIWEALDNQFTTPNDTLEHFYNRYKRIYIYGAGLCAKNLDLYFRHKGWKYEGIVVTNKENQDMDCLELDEICIDGETGVIISILNPEVSEEVVTHIGNRCKREQLFLISDCGAIRLPK